jgi:SAM-dependent methyltransferase
VTLDQVIEHAMDPVQLLREAAAVLRPGGRVLLSTPNARSLTARILGRRWVHWHTPYHLQLFSIRSLLAAAQGAGLRPVEIRRITHPRWYGFQWLHLLSRPEPGVASIYWTHGKWPAGRLAARKLLSGLGWMGVNHGFALVLDTLRLGDNLVVSLEKENG